VKTKIESSVWVLILNWQNSKDTIECLESIVQANDHSIKGVVVCDNGSNDSSLKDIRSWFNAKEVNFANLHYADNTFLDVDTRKQFFDNEAFVLIDNAHNLGFAGGNNIGLKFIMSCADYDYVYLLNNDTVINSTTVSSLVQYCEANSQIGMCGSKVVYYHEPDRVQLYAGSSFNPIWGRAKSLGAFKSVIEEPSVSDVEAELDYVLGASLILSKDCLSSVGLMEERYFLYYEEIDWAIRAKSKGFKLGFAKESTLLHKAGASIGSSSDNEKRSMISLFYIISSRMKVTAKFYPYFIPTVFLFSMSQAVRELLKGNVKGFWMMSRACFGLSFK
jgi:hypothetical protein